MQCVKDMKYSYAGIAILSLFRTMESLCQMISKDAPQCHQQQTTKTKRLDVDTSLAYMKDTNATWGELRVERK
tara:strand:- start:229 stop:447 length:219 start_codon:yes stop_codon:yes gene_type:complete